MAVDLFEHNRDAFGKIEEALADGKKKFAISHATGTGKSYIIAKLSEKFNQEKKLILLPSRYIKEQIEGLFTKYGIGNTDFLLYQKLIKMDDDEISKLNYQLIVLDEYHHDTARVWGNKVKYLMNSHPDSVIFGTSATHIRCDGVNVIDELFEGNCISELPLSQAIAKKVVPIPRYVAALYTLDDELDNLMEKVRTSTNTKEEKEEFMEKIKAMRSQIEKSYGMPIILNRYVKDRSGKYIVFCKNKKHLNDIQNIAVEWFKTAGFKDIHTYTVHSSYEMKDREYGAFCDDKSSALKLLFCVNMLNEGLHLEDISGVLMLRPTNSNIIWHQQIGRCIESNNSKTPIIIDSVNNFSSVGQGVQLLKDIKDAVRKEKEGSKDFDDSDFLDIDTFFVTEYVLDVEQMFKEIEGRLTDGWDVMFKEYCKFHEENGHGDVPKKYGKLGSWCTTQRQDLKNGILRDHRKITLDEHGFIWDVHKYKFNNNVKGCINFHKEHGKLPSAISTDKNEKRLGSFIYNIRNEIKNNKKNSEWKINMLQQIPTFFDERKSRFDSFCENSLLYKERYGHVDIKRQDIIDGYRIGNALSSLRQDYKNNKLTDEQISKLKNLGINISCGKHEQQFSQNMELARQALEKGVCISQSNPLYKDINLYTWYMSNKNKFSNRELEIMNKLIPSNKRPIKIIEANTGKVLAISQSINEAGRILYHNFHATNNEKQGGNAIYKRLNGSTTKNPIYKGRFRFEYAEDTPI